MKRIALVILLLASITATGQTLTDYIKRVDTSITTKNGKPQTVTPSVVGNRLAELARYVQDNGILTPERRNLDSAFSRSPISITNTGLRTLSLNLQGGRSLRVTLPVDADSAKTDSTLVSIGKRVDTAISSNVSGFAFNESTGEIIIYTNSSDTLANSYKAILPWAADSMAMPSAVVAYYMPTDVAISYDNFTTNGTSKLSVTLSDFQTNIPIFVRSGTYWRKILINFPTTNFSPKDSTLRMTGRMSTYPFKYNAPVLLDRNVRSGIVSIEIDHPDYKGLQLYLRGFGKGFLTSGVYNNYLMLSEASNPGATWAGGISGTGIWVYNAVTDTGVQTYPILKSSIGRVGWARVNWDSVATGYRHGIGSTTAQTAPLHEMVTLTRNITYAMNPPETKHLPYSRDTLMLPSELFFVDNNPLSIYWDNCLTNDSITNKANKRLGCVIMGYDRMNPIHILNDRQITLDPTQFKDGDTAFFYCTYQVTADINTKRTFYKHVVLHKSTTAGISSADTAIIWSFGDSIWDFDMTDTVYNRIVRKCGANIIWAGTKKNGFTRDDGRASIEAATYLGAQTYYSPTAKWPVDTTLTPWNTNLTITNNFCNPLIRRVQFGADIDTADWYRYTPSLLGGTSDGKLRERTYLQDIAAGTYQSFVDSGGQYYHMAIAPYIRQTGFDTTQSPYKTNKKIWMWLVGYNDNNHKDINGNENTDTSYYIALKAFRAAVRKVREFDSTINFVANTYLTVNRTISNDKPYTDYVQQVIAISDSLKTIGWRVSIVPSFFEVDRTIPYDWANIIRQSVLVDTLGSTTITLSAANSGVKKDKIARGPGIRASGSKIIELSSTDNSIKLADPLVDNLPGNTIITFSDGEDLIPGVNNVKTSYGGDSIHPFAVPGIQIVANTIYPVIAYIISKL
jgi:hypothetical protein